MITTGFSILWLGGISEKQSSGSGLQEGLGFRVQAIVFKLKGLGFKVEGLRLRLRPIDLDIRLRKLLQTPLMGPRFLKFRVQGTLNP